MDMRDSHKHRRPHYAKVPREPDSGLFVSLSNATLLPAISLIPALMPRFCAEPNCYPVKRRRVLPRQPPQISPGATSDPGTSTAQPTATSSNDTGAVVRCSAFGRCELMYSPSVGMAVCSCFYGCDYFPLSWPYR